MGLARDLARDFDFVDVIENRTNVGYGAAVNQAFRKRPAEYLAALNDDATMSPKCLEALIGALSADSNAGMAAPRILLAGTGTIDSAGMLLARDGSSIQRGHARSAALWDAPNEALFPSGCAAVYRSAMLAETGLFDESLFLYHEDTDIGLRARWLGWRCLYVPGAEVEHQYSASSGRASLTKAWYVERNRLRTVWKLFPLPDLLAAHLYSAARYLLHFLAAISGRGRAAEFAASGMPFWMLPWLVIKAHVQLMVGLGEILRLRRQTPRRLTSREFRAVLAAHRVGIREVALH
jgi:GT2 family glycosyltransferase